MIFWFSSLIHSAKCQDENAQINPNDKWSEWRGVVYICYHPKDKINNQQLQLLQYAFDENKSLNHWCKNILGTRNTGIHHPNIMRYLENSKLFYEEIDRPMLTEEIKELIS